MTIIKPNSQADDIPHKGHMALKVCAVLFLVLSMAGVSFVPVEASTLATLLRPWAEEKLDYIQEEGNSFSTISTNVLTARAEQARKEAFAEEEILWLARTLYSETKISWEQRLVAWVIRNRVESPYYPDTFKEVVLAPKQFSGLNKTDKNYWTNISLDKDTSHPAWESALVIAEEVYYAHDSKRSLSYNVTHFYSPHAVRNHPEWADGEPAHTVSSADGSYTRFAFYADVN